MESWIKLHRKILNWEWYKNSDMFHLFIHLLLSANNRDGSWMGHEIKRGQMITGRVSLSRATGISEQSIRTCLKRLKSTNEITIVSTKHFSLITICEYDSYQDTKKKINQPINQPTNQQLTNNQPTTNHKQEEEIYRMKEEELKKRTHDFEIAVKDYREAYSFDMLKDFYAYWSELNKTKTKMRWELQQTFEIERRLQTWAKIDSQFKPASQRTPVVAVPASFNKGPGR